MTGRQRLNTLLLMMLVAMVFPASGAGTTVEPAEQKTRQELEQEKRDEARERRLAAEEWRRENEQRRRDAQERRRLAASETPDVASQEKKETPNAWWRFWE